MLVFAFFDLNFGVGGRDLHFYPTQTKLWEGNVFTGVCLSLCSLFTGTWVPKHQIPDMRPSTLRRVTDLWW